MTKLEAFPVAKNGKLEPIQVDMMKVLDDMKRHWREELYKCLYDNFSDSATNLANNVNYHVCMMRKHLAEEGKFGIITHRVSVGNIQYQKVPLTMTMPSPV